MSGRVIKPCDCAIAFAIPTSFEEFSRDLDAPNKNFARFFREKFGSWAWDEYRRQIVRDYERVAHAITETGAEVHTGVTLREFGELFRRGRFRVVVLFAHWHEDAVEFHDGFAPVGTIVEQIPDDFDGVADLCVCHSNHLREQLSVRRPKCLVKFGDAEATPDFWLYFYLGLLKHLKLNERAYIDALDDALNAFWAEARRRRRRGTVMKWLRVKMEQYLSGVGLLGPIKLGGDKGRPAVEEQNQAFVEAFKRRSKSDDWLLVTAVIMIWVLFGVAIYLLFYHRDDVKIIALIFSILILSHAGILRFLRQLWVEKNVIDISVNVMKSMPPEQAAKFIQSLYRGLVKSASEKSSSRGEDIRPDPPSG